MNRGDLVTIVSSGDYGKPRPALIIQSGVYADHPSVTVLPLTSELHDALPFRITVEPDTTTGLQRRSQIMVDKATTVPRAKVGTRIGRLDKAITAEVSQALAGFLGIG